MSLFLVFIGMYLSLQVDSCEAQRAERDQTGDPSAFEPDRCSVLREEGLEDTTHLPLQRRMGADVLEETGLVVDPQLLLLLLALLVVLVQLAHLRPNIT